jgi:hypothetical protein
MIINLIIEWHRGLSIRLAEIFAELALELIKKQEGV